MRGTAAVIVHWGAADETVACVERAQAGGVAGVIVVDNGGAPDLAAALGRVAPEARIVRAPRNLGYAGGGNLGIAVARETAPAAILLLNNDARLEPGADAAARARLASDARIAVVGGRIRTREDPARLWLAWGDVTFGRNLVALRGAGALDGPAWQAARDVDWVAGCALWFRPAALDALGGLDEDFFAYHEEVDWCARARAAGWRVVYEPAAVVSHTGRGSDGGPASIRVRQYFAARNAVLFARRHGTPAERARHALALAAGLAAELAWHGLRGTIDGPRWKLRGVRDALAGRPPPFEALGLR